ncbi:MAG TPA: hypothetical protein VFN26_20295 [Candidatus Acidoferrum sp.]|nr:hypothetical protein [Candidatus Acidoferrum sp.]
MTRHTCILVCLAFVSAAIPLRAVNRPHAGTAKQNSVAWTNDDLEKLHDLGLISIVGPTNEEVSASETGVGPYVMTDDRQWYAKQSAELHAELERRATQLRQYLQALEDARSLRKMTGGVSLDEGDIAITPEAGIEILQQRVGAQQAKLDALEDLARRRDIPPGVLRGQ